MRYQKYLKLAVTHYRTQKLLAEALTKFSKEVVTQEYISRWIGTAKTQRGFPATLIIPLEKALNEKGASVTRSDIDPIIYPPN